MDGHVTLCMHCGEWAVFQHAAPGHLVKPNDAQYQTIAASKVFTDVRGAWLEAREAVDKAKQSSAPEAPPFHAEFYKLVDRAIRPIIPIEPGQLEVLKVFFYMGALKATERAQEPAESRADYLLRLTKLHRQLNAYLRETIDANMEE